MAEHDGKVWEHIGDLHRKHAELSIQMHEKHGADGEHQEAAHELMKKHADQIEHLTHCVDELTAAVKELTVVMREDVKADKAVAGERRGREPKGT